MILAKVDRLSSLPDDLIHKILSFIGLEKAVETSVLSSRWRFIWTLMPYLNISTNDCYKLPISFADFVIQFLDRRSNMIDVFSGELRFIGEVNQVVIEKIVDYTLSHNIQQLTVVYRPKDQINLQRSLFSSRSLKHLTLKRKINYSRLDTFQYSVPPTSTWELPALTTLYLNGITLLDDSDDKRVSLFFKCANLKNLTLKRCRTNMLDSLSICHPRLSNLTLVRSDFLNVKFVNVIAPQLKNLTIRKCWGKYVISSPGLASLLYDGWDPSQLFAEGGFHSLEKADLCVSDLDESYAHEFVCVLQQLQNVKFLTLSFEFLELLNSSIELMSRKPSPYVNLTRIIINVYMSEKPNKKVTLSNEVKNYFLDSAPTATFTIVSDKELDTLFNAIYARTYMAELQTLLEQCKTDINTNMTDMDQGTTPMESHSEKSHKRLNAQPHTENQMHFGGMITQIERYWEDLNEQLLQGSNKTSRINSLTRRIKELLENVPPSQSENLQARFLSLCAEADITIEILLNHIHKKSNLIRSKNPFKCMLQL